MCRLPSASLCQASPITQPHGSMASWSCMVPPCGLTFPPYEPPHLSLYACCAWSHPKLAAQSPILSPTALQLQACCACPALTQAIAWTTCPVPMQAGSPSDACCVRAGPSLPAPASSACRAHPLSACGLLLSACFAGGGVCPSATPWQHGPAELALKPEKFLGSASCTGPGSGCRLPHRCCTSCCRR